MIRNKIRCPYDGKPVDDFVETDLTKNHVVFFCLNCHRIVEVNNVTGDWYDNIEVLIGGSGSTVKKE